MQQQVSTFGRRGVQQPSAAPRVTSPNPVHPSAQSNAPRAAPASPNFLVWLLTSFEGRTRRMHYWLAIIGISVFAVIGEAVVRAIFPHYPTTLQMLANPSLMFDHSIANLAPATLMLLVSIPAIYMRVAVITKRWHDRGKTG